MINQEVIDEVVVVTFSNVDKLNILIADAVKNELTMVVRDFDKILLNLNGVRFIDSTGLGVLITMFKRARENDKVFKICCVEPDAMELIRITKLDNVFDIYTFKEEGIKSF